MTKQPSYRFADYDEPWTEKKLGELADIVRGASPRPIQDSKWFDKESDVGWLRISDVTEQDGRIYKLEQRISKLGQEKTRVLFEPHLLLSIAATVGKPVVNYVKTGVHDGFLIFLAPRFNQEFLFQWLDMFRPQWQKYGQPGSQVNLNSDIVKNQAISLPSLPEQTAIGSFFQDMDQLISLQQRKLEVLKEQKKTYLKLLFPVKGQTKPALRFAEFEDEWKEVKLGEVLKKNNKKNRDLAINNVESVSNKLGFVKQTEQFEDYSVASADLSNYYVISEKQFAYNPSRINVGSIAYKKEGDTLSVVSPLYISFSTVENIDDSYLWYWLKTSLFDSQRAIHSEGGVRDTLSFNQLSDIELIFPSLPEQEAIGSFFQDLDKAIAKQEEKVNQLKESKQTLLRKMFI